MEYSLIFYFLFFFQNKKNKGWDRRGCNKQTNGKKTKKTFKINRVSGITAGRFEQRKKTKKI